jgi:hypothetical protein
MTTPVLAAMQELRRLVRSRHVADTAQWAHGAANLIAVYHSWPPPDSRKQPMTAVSGLNIREQRSCLMNPEYHTAT